MGFLKEAVEQSKNRQAVGHAVAAGGIAAGAGGLAYGLSVPVNAWNDKRKSILRRIEEGKYKSVAEAKAAAKAMTEAAMKADPEGFADLNKRMAISTLRRMGVKGLRGAATMAVPAAVAAYFVSRHMHKDS